MSIEYPFLNINIIFFVLLFSFHGPSLQHNKLKCIVSPLRKKQRWKTIWDCNLPKVRSSHLCSNSLIFLKLIAEWLRRNNWTFQRWFGQLIGTSWKLKNWRLLHVKGTVSRDGRHLVFFFINYVTLYGRLTLCALLLKYFKQILSYLVSFFSTRNGATWHTTPSRN